jgi:plastocyanin
MRKISGLLGAVALMLAMTSCGGDSTSPGGGGGGGGGGGTCPAGTFCMGASNFSPTARTVAAGSTVTWRNESGTGHNVTWDNATGRSAALPGDAAGDIPEFSSGDRTRLFSAAGAYGFHCTIHAGMNGTLTVQ